MAPTVVGYPEESVALAAGRAGVRRWSRGLCIVATPTAVVGIKSRLFTDLRIDATVGYDEIVSVVSEEYALEITGPADSLRLEFALPSQLDALFEAIQKRRR